MNDFLERSVLLNIFNKLPQNIYWMDQEGRILGCNDNQAKSVGLNSTEDLVGKNIFDVAKLLNWPEFIPKKIHENDLYVMQTCKRQVFEEKIILNGENHIFLSYKDPWVKEDGTVAGVVGISVDITAQKTDEECCREALDKEIGIRDFVIEQTVGNLYWKDLEGRYLGCNKAFADDLGLSSPEEIVGKNDYEIAHKNLNKEEIDKIVAIDREVISSGKECLIEEISVNRRGERAYFMTKKVPLRDKKGRVVGLVGNSIDITAQKEAEKREQEALIKATEARARAEAEETLRNTILVFADAIAHNQRTPLSVINSVAAVFEKILGKLMPVYEEAKALNLKTVAALNNRERLYVTEKVGIDALHRAAKTMNANIDSNLQSLRVALKARTGTLTLEDLTCCQMDDNLKLIESNYAIAEHEVALVHIDRSYDFDYLGSTLLTDQIFDNLTRNALYQIRKHHKGEIFVTTEDGGEMNVVRFRDTAGGAPSDVVSHLFDTHFTTKAEGNGVGLAFCKTTMQLFGGDITCHSVHGDYIEFVLSFPKLSA